MLPRMDFLPISMLEMAVLLLFQRQAYDGESVRPWGELNSS